MLNIRVNKQRVQGSLKGDFTIICAETAMAVRFVFDAIKETGGEADARIFLSSLTDRLLDDIFTRPEMDGEPVCRESED